MRCVNLLEPSTQLPEAATCAAGPSDLLRRADRKLPQWHHPSVSRIFIRKQGNCSLQALWLRDNLSECLASTSTRHHRSRFEFRPLFPPTACRSHTSDAVHQALEDSPQGSSPKWCWRVPRGIGLRSLAGCAIVRYAETSNDGEVPTHRN